MKKIKSSVKVLQLKKSEDIKLKVSKFTYFDEWDKEIIDELCNISKIKTFIPDQIILGGEFDQKSYVHFITKGSCRVIECLNIQTIYRNNKIVYKLKEEPTNQSKTYFIEVYKLNTLSCFNIGENLNNRQITAITYTECLLIPYYWLLEHNKANIWMRIQQFLTWKLPTTEKIFEVFKEELKWRQYKNKLTDSKMRRRIGNLKICDVPYSLKVSLEEI